MSKFGEGVKIEKEQLFEIGRQDAGLNFEVYESAATEEEAVIKYREQVSRVSDPGEIIIFEKGSKKTRKDLMTEAIPALEIDLENVTLDTPLDMENAKKLGVHLVTDGGTWYDYHGQPMSLDEMARIEASSNDRLNTAKDNGKVNIPKHTRVRWDDDQSALAKQYAAKVAEYTDQMKQ